MKFKLKKINLFYYNVPNFGDALGLLLIREFSEYKVYWKDIGISRRERFFIVLMLDYNKMKNILWPNQKVLGAIGSILSWLPKGAMVWGAGFMNDSELFKGGDVFAVRGKLTDYKLREQGWKGCNVYGDPALLLPLWLRSSPKKKYRLGMIPHWGDVDFFVENYGGLYKIIDSRTRNIRLVVDEINKCEYILSSSLHGIIVAHAYGIPALWIKNGDIGSLNGFKFKDYFSSVDIPFYDGFDCSDERLLNGDWVKLFDSNKDKIDINCSLKEIQNNLLRSAPFHLKEKYFKLISDSENHIDQE
ncbi:polysaccharide pyruvyl transferase family protein [Elizabethkingia anophelis]|nr:polysaccharide pyruvyl transferase family protein [Elizabethkingia anophelis]